MQSRGSIAAASTKAPADRVSSIGYQNRRHGWRCVVPLLTMTISLLSPIAPAHAEATCEPDVQNAVEEPGRIETNSNRDEGRRPCEVLSFFGVEPGAVHLELLAAQGYYTEILSVLVGREGRVYHHNNALVLQLTPPDQLVPIRNRIESGELSNAEWIEGELEALPFANGSVDSISAILSLHDYYWMSRRPESSGFAELFRILRPGGRLLVVDHSAQPETTVSAAVDQNGIHRIDQRYLTERLLDVGFVFEAESDILRNPADDRSKPFFDRSMWRDRTDRFVMIFGKPGEQTSDED
ncbi:class I SAM-dependent methyltransferase [Parasphingopyxis algicola]|uniref:methyltransferase domain-containing protein n=1 Tax=Parasphingopyxis algicola TaxID=2026624 RepID=UPI0015A329BC|nr:methyltransferase domain-containing protein [Parasphingopyxis algicola]QLC25198.1 class I SAM-dependent methyltransferase [Parasphingopyxis algicola]